MFTESCLWMLRGPEGRCRDWEREYFHFCFLSWILWTFYNEFVFFLVKETNEQVLFKLSPFNPTLLLIPFVNTLSVCWSPHWPCIFPLPVLVQPSPFTWNAFLWHFYTSMQVLSKLSTQFSDSCLKRTLVFWWLASSKSHWPFTSLPPLGWFFVRPSVSTRIKLSKGYFLQCLSDQCLLSKWKKDSTSSLRLGTGGVPFGNKANAMRWVGSSLAPNISMFSMMTTKLRTGLHLVYLYAVPFSTNVNRKLPTLSHFTFIHVSQAFLFTVS